MNAQHTFQCAICLCGFSDDSGGGRQEADHHEDPEDTQDDSRVDCEVCGAGYHTDCLKKYVASKMLEGMPATCCAPQEIGCAAVLDPVTLGAASTKWLYGAKTDAFMHAYGGELDACVRRVNQVVTDLLPLINVTTLESICFRLQSLTEAHAFLERWMPAQNPAAAHDALSALTSKTKCGVCLMGPVHEATGQCASCGAHPPSLADTYGPDVQVVRCPRPMCVGVIEHGGGCSNMYCTKCGKFFDWRTGMPLAGVYHNPEYLQSLNTKLGAGTVGLTQPDARDAVLDTISTLCPDALPVAEWMLDRLDDISMDLLFFASWESMIGRLKARFVMCLRLLRSVSLEDVRHSMYCMYEIEGRCLEGARIVEQYESRMAEVCFAPESYGGDPAILRGHLRGLYQECIMHVLYVISNDFRKAKLELELTAESHRYSQWYGGQPTVPEWTVQMPTTT